MVFALQFGRWGFRINGGPIESHATRAEAEAALWRILASAH